MSDFEYKDYSPIWKIMNKLVKNKFPEKYKNVDNDCFWIKTDNEIFRCALCEKQINFNVEDYLEHAKFHLGGLISFI